MPRNHLAANFLLVAATGAILACAPTPPPGRVYVVREPPPQRTEVILTRPGPEFVWVGGHWNWSGTDYEWFPGRWVPFERGHREWQPGRWAHNRHGWYWVEGKWN